MIYLTRYVNIIQLIIPIPLSLLNISDSLYFSVVVLHAVFMSALYVFPLLESFT